MTEEEILEFIYERHKESPEALEWKKRMLTSPMDNTIYIRKVKP